MCISSDCEAWGELPAHAEKTVYIKARCLSASSAVKPYTRPSVLSGSAVVMRVRRTTRPPFRIRVHEWHFALHLCVCTARSKRRTAQHPRARVSYFHSVAARRKWSSHRQCDPRDAGTGAARTQPRPVHGSISAPRAFLSLVGARERDARLVRVCRTLTYLIARAVGLSHPCPPPPRS